jgi:hypothetical protein
MADVGEAVELFEPLLHCPRGHGMVPPFSIGVGEDYGKREYQFCPHCFGQWAQEQWPLDSPEEVP